MSVSRLLLPERREVPFVLDVRKVWRQKEIQKVLDVVLMVDMPLPRLAAPDSWFLFPYPTPQAGRHARQELDYVRDLRAAWDKNGADRRTQRKAVNLRAARAVDIESCPPVFMTSRVCRSSS